MKEYAAPFLGHLKKRDEGEGKGMKWCGLLWERWKGEKGKGEVKDTSMLLQKFWREDGVLNNKD
jgi:hypothetical protein